MAGTQLKQSTSDTQTRRVSVKLTLSEHRRFKAQAAFLGMTMDEALHRAVIEYSSKLARPPLSEAEKADLKRINAITDAIERRAPELFAPDEDFSPETFVRRLRDASTAASNPSLDDLNYLGQERIQKMLHQKAGTGTAFLSRNTGVYAVRHRGAGEVSQSESRLPKTASQVPLSRRTRP